MTQEGELIGRACSGDPEAFDALVAPHLPRIYRLAFLIARDREAAADAVQEALIRAYRALGNLRPHSPFYPWFARIAVNEAVKQKQRWRRLVHWFTGQIREMAVSHPAMPEAAVQAREDQAEIWEAIQRLSPAHRTVIVLRYYDELSETEMAEVLGVPPGTVKSRLFHARSKLEHLLGTKSAIRAQLQPAMRGGESHD